MAVVYSVIACTGAKCNFCDDEYIDKPPAVIKARVRDANIAAYDILVTKALNDQGGMNNAENRRDDRQREG